MPDDVHTPDHPGFALLRAGVPLSLLCDLAMALDTREVYAAEPADTTWLVSHTA